MVPKIYNLFRRSKLINLINLLHRWDNNIGGPDAGGDFQPGQGAAISTGNSGRSHCGRLRYCHVNYRGRHCGHVQTSPPQTARTTGSEKTNEVHIEHITDMISIKSDLRQESTIAVVRIDLEWHYHQPSVNCRLERQPETRVVKSWVRGRTVDVCFSSCRNRLGRLDGRKPILDTRPTRENALGRKFPHSPFLLFFVSATKLCVNRAFSILENFFREPPIKQTKTVIHLIC